MTDFGAADEAFAVALQPDGKIVAAGRLSTSDHVARAAIARYDADGTLDKSFDGDGRLTYGLGAATGVAVQRDGKIVVATPGPEAALARALPDGTPDHAFGNNGIARLGVGALGFVRVLVQRDGKLVAAGGRSVVRFTRRGARDRTFSRDGKAAAPVTIRDAAVTGDGKILVVGVRIDPRKRSDLDDYPIHMIVARYRANGALDRSFGRRGVVTRRLAARDCCVASSIAVQRNGRIVIGGYSYRGSAAVARLHRNGSRDFGFGRSGVATLDGTGVGALAIDRRGRVVAAVRLGLGVARLAPNGTVEFEKSVTTIGTADTWAVTVDRRNRILAAGFVGTLAGANPPRDFAVARFSG